MKQPKAPLKIKRVLDICDRWGGLRKQISEEKSERDPRELRPLRLRTRRMERALSDGLKDGRLPGTLGDIAARCRFDSSEILIVLTLLQRRVARGNSYVQGREVLQLLFDSSYEILKGGALLSKGGKLRTSGVVSPHLKSAGYEDVLEMDFKLDDSIFLCISEEIAGESDETARAAHPITPYSSNKEYLLDLRYVSLLYQKRSNKLFRTDYWDDPDAGGPEDADFVTGQIERAWDRVHARLEATPEPGSLALIRFQIENQLSESEMIIIVTLFFQELLFGNAFIEVVELLKLISNGEAEVIDHRNLLSRRAPLVQREIVTLDVPVGDKELVAEATLTPWAQEKLLFEAGSRGKPLDERARREFKNFLRSIRGSDEFFRGLERRPR